MWVIQPLLAPNSTLLSTDVRIQLRVEHPYQNQSFTGVNQGRPAYTFTTSGIVSATGISDIQADELDRIKVVPNPYYAYSTYQQTQLDNRIKITNLPERCTIRIFNMAGQLVKTIEKANPLTFQDWDLKNESGIIIAGGLYVFHIDIPDIGERILKWYGAIRTIDTTNL